MERLPPDLPLPQSIDALLAAFRDGGLTPIELAQKILIATASSQESINPDTDRARRTGFAEVIYGAGKSPDSIRRGTDTLLQSNEEVLITRVTPEQVRTLTEWYPLYRWDSVARTLRIGRSEQPVAPEFVTIEPSVREQTSTGQPRKARAARGRVAVVSAGTTDEPIAREAVETLAWMGVPTRLIQDIGVAGPYRLIARVAELQSMVAIVCVAGMEGALPSVLAGHVGCPVIAVPTSVGYGANLGGVSALLSMLNSCAANVAVVNIDAGFKGGYMAGLIATEISP